MPDWAIILIAAFGGGLAGAVLQPVVSHFLEEVRAKEEIRKGLQRELRRMIEDEIEWSGRLIGASKAIAGYEAEIGHHPEFDKRQSIVGEAGDEAASWRNYRIPDGRLRSKADEFLRTARTVRELLLEGPIRDPGEPPDRQLLNSIRELERLEPEIVTRMDKLKWPVAGK